MEVWVTVSAVWAELSKRTKVSRLRERWHRRAVWEGIYNLLVIRIRSENAK